MLMLTFFCDMSTVFSVPLLLSWLIVLGGVTLYSFRLVIRLVLSVLTFFTGNMQMSRYFLIS